MFLAGLTAVVDWIGSNQAFFPSIGNCSNYLDDSEERVRGYFGLAEERAADALACLGWTDHAELPNTRPGFQRLFGSQGGERIRPLQEAADRVALQLDRPTLIPIKAPMGEGKT
jgi:hypothetical protein